MHVQLSTLQSSRLIVVAAIIALGPLITPATAGASPVSSQPYSAPNNISSFEATGGREDFPFTFSTPYENGVILGAFTEELSISFDSGDTWMPHPTFSGFPSLFKASGDGSTLVTGIHDTYSDPENPAWFIQVMLRNGQANSEPIRIPSQANSLEIGISDDGERMTAIPGYTYDDPTTPIFTSNDSGASWQQQFVFDQQTDEDLRASYTVNTSPDGSVITAVSFHNTLASVSFDYGTTWTQISDIDAITRLQVSPDQQYILLEEYDGNTYKNYISPLQVGEAFTWTLIDEPFAHNYDLKNFYGHPDGSVSILRENTHYRSEDGGATWQTLTSFPGQLDQDKITFSRDGSFGVHRQINDVTSTIFSTTNYGQSWQHRSVPSSDSFYINPDISHNGMVMSARWLNNALVPFFITKDQGLHWTNPVNKGYKYWTIAQQSADGQVIFASYAYAETIGTLRTIHLVSKDGGMSWREIPTPSFMDTWDSRRLGVSPDGKLLLSQVDVAASPEPLLYISRDSGTSWSAAPFPTLNRIDGMSTSKNGQTILVEGIDGTSFEQVYYASRDFGQNWQRVADPAIADLSGTYLSLNGAIFMYGLDTEGASTMRVSQAFNETSTEIPIPESIEIVHMSTNASGKTLIITGKDPAMNSVAYSSQDEGGTWIPAAMPVEIYSGTSPEDQAITVSLDGQVLLISGFDEEWQTELKVSTDGGVSWRTISSSVSESIGIILDVSLTQYGRIILNHKPDYSSPSTLQYSDDGGQNWYSIENTSKYYGSLTVSASAIGNSLVMFNEGYPSILYKSTLVADTAPSFSFTPNNQHSMQPPQSTNPNAPQKITNTRPAFSGTSLPFSLVTVTVNSDPIICTTTADANGNWSCTLPSAIPNGLHTITIMIEDPVSGLQTPYGPYYIQVGPNQVITGDEDGISTPVNSVPGVPATGFNAVELTTPLITGLGLLVLAGVGTRRIIRSL